MHQDTCMRTQSYATHPRSGVGWSEIWAYFTRTYVRYIYNILYIHLLKQVTPILPPIISRQSWIKSWLLYMFCNWEMIIWGCGLEHLASVNISLHTTQFTQENPDLKLVHAWYESNTTLNLLVCVVQQLTDMPTHTISPSLPIQTQCTYIHHRCCIHFRRCALHIINQLHGT